MVRIEYYSYIKVHSVNYYAYNFLNSMNYM